MFSSRRGTAAWSRRQMLAFTLGAASLYAESSNELRVLPPVDEESKDEKLAELLTLLRKCAIAQDLDPIEEMLFARFRVEFDGGQGSAAFHRRWDETKQRTTLWKVLSRLLSIGGTFYSPTLFAVPYVYALFPLDLDPLAHVVAVGKDIPLLRRPELTSPSLGALAYEILPLVKPLAPPVVIDPESFVEVVHPRFGRSFVMGYDVWSPAGHRLFFERRGGVWKWISFAGATLDDPPGVPPRN